MTDTPMEVVAWRARFMPTESGYEYTWELSRNDPTPYCTYDVVEPLVTLSAASATIKALEYKKRELLERCVRLNNRAEAAEAERDALRKALEWYSRGGHDCGVLARQALSGGKE